MSDFFLKLLINHKKANLSIKLFIRVKQKWTMCNLILLGNRSSRMTAVNSKSEVRIFEASNFIHCQSDANMFCLLHRTDDDALKAEVRQNYSRESTLLDKLWEIIIRRTFIYCLETTHN